MLSVTKALDEGYKTILKKPKIYFVSLILVFIVLLLSFSLNFYMPTYPSVKFSLSLILIIFLFSLIGMWFNIFLIKLTYDKKSNIKNIFLFSVRKFIPYFFASIIFMLIMLAIFGVFFFLMLLSYLFLYITSLYSKLIFAIILFIFLIPAIYIYIRFLFYGHAIIIDNESVFSSLEKSWKITGKNSLRIFLILLFLILISFGFYAFSYIFLFLHTAIHLFFTFLLEAFLLAFYTTTLVSAYLQLSRNKSKVL